MRIFKMMLVLTLFTFVNLEADEEKTEIIHLTPEQISDNQIEIRTSGPAILYQTFSVPGKITVNELGQAVVVAKAPGIVTRVSKNIGDAVQKDEVLASLESKEMAEAKAAYMTALKREELAAQTLKAEEALKDKKISSEQDYLHALLAAEEARINLEVAAQQLALLGLSTEDIRQLALNGLSNLCCYQIKSPFQGVIIDKNIALGSLVKSEQEVFKIADLDTVWVELGIYPNNLSQIKPGHKINLSPLKEETPKSQAQITRVSPLIDEHTRTATATALLNNSSRDWVPGSYIKAEIVIDEIKVPLAVLKQAVQEIEGKTFVFIKHPDGFEKKEVKIGQSDNTNVEILSGLDANTPYAAINAFILKAEDGKKDAEL